MQLLQRDSLGLRYVQLEEDEQEGNKFNQIQELHAHTSGGAGMLRVEAEYAAYNGEMLSVLLPEKVLVIKHDVQLLSTESDDNIPSYKVSVKPEEEWWELPKSGIKDAMLSPLGSYLVTFTQPGKDEDPNKTKNLEVYDVRSPTSSPPTPIYAMSFPRRSALPLQWTIDESFLSFANPNTIVLMKFPPAATTIEAEEENGAEASASSNKAKNTILRFPAPNHGSYALSPTLPLAVALFTPAIKNKACEVCIVAIPPGKKEPEVVCSASFFRATEASFEWSRDGTAVLVKAETTHDATGQSYYGESSLYLLRRQKEPKQTPPSAIMIPPLKEGSIHSIAFSPNSKEFCVVAGRMPTKCSLHSSLDGSLLCEFESETGRNTISFCPFGRFLVLAGFGNLPGNIEFWEIKSSSDKKKAGKSSHKGKLLGKAKAKNPPVKWGWSPDGRRFMTASTAPRMNVDNGIEVFTYYGAPLVLAPVNILYNCQYQPLVKGQVYKNRGVSPERKFDDVIASTKSTSVANTTEAEAPKPKVGVYRPPGSTGVVAAMMRADRGFTDNASTTKAIVGASNRQVIGATTANVKTPIGAEPQPKKPSSSSGPSKDDLEQKLRKLKKTLNQIEEIAQKKKSGAQLNEDQIQKLSKKTDVEREVANLQKQISNLTL